MDISDETKKQLAEALNEYIEKVRSIGNEHHKKIQELLKEVDEVKLEEIKKKLGI